ncbi:MAG: ABC transporter permease [Lachnospiraceae bacterium]|nr:ABC transporter permease [Lachnospiraceae bacterium]
MDSKTMKYILKRLLLAIVTLWIIITITFLIMHAVPGSPFIKQKAITQATMDALNAKYGLDKPLFQQYLIYLGNAVRLDFGESISYKGRTVMSLIGQGFATSAFLGICAAIIALIVGLALGSWAATHRGKFIDQAILVLSTASVSVPSFVIGVILLWCLTVWLPIFPSAGQSVLKVFAGQGNFAGFILPIISLALYPTAYITRLTRSSMLDALGQDYIRTAQAKGVSKGSLIFKHALKNSLAPVISYAGPMIAGIMTGSFVVESIFSIPGIGGYFISSIKALDYTMIMGTTILLSILMLLLNLIADILYKVVDHRVDLA